VTTLMTGQEPGTTELLDDDVDLGRDRLLVERAQAGDRAAFDDLYLRYYRRLYRFCLRRLQDAHEAEDITQEAFARAWRALPSFAGDRRFYPWLSVIAAHLCTDVLRRRNRSTPVAEFHQAHMASIEDGGEERVVAAVDSDLVARAFTRLSARHQRILSLREGSGWSYQMIADHEGVGITAIETLLWRARQALKREFASLAGSDGRLAGIGGLLVALAGLRHWLGRLATAARRAGSSVPWTATAAITTSAIATTALVLGVTRLPDVAQPPARSTLASVAPTSPGTGRPAAAGASTRASASSSVDHHAGGRVPSLGPTGGSLAAAVRTATRLGDTGRAGLSPVTSTVTHVGGALVSQLGSLTEQLGTALGSLGSPVAPAWTTDAGTLGAPVAPLLGAAVGAPNPSVAPLLAWAAAVAGQRAPAVEQMVDALRLLVVTSGTGIQRVGRTVAEEGAHLAASGSADAPASTTCLVGSTLSSVTTLVGSGADAAPGSARCP